MKYTGNSQDSMTNINIKQCCILSVINKNKTRGYFYLSD